MNTALRELLKEYVQSRHFTSTAEIMAAMKEMFRDVIQTVMEVEMDEELGRERCQRAETSSAPNYRNGYTKKTVKVTADLKKIYTSVTLDEAEENLLQFSEKWRKQHSSCVKSWEENWEVLSTFYEYLPEVREIIYTTKIIEGLNRQFRQITKNKPSFTNDDSLRRMLYLASRRITRRWRTRCRSWELVLSQLQLMSVNRAVG